MPDHISIFGFFAILLYVPVLLTCLMAARTASVLSQPRWHYRVWIFLSLLFVAMIVLRALGLEDFIRETLRDLLRDGGNYEDRRRLQGVVASLLLAIAAFGGLFWFYRQARRLRGRRNIIVAAALACGVSMTFLVGLRFISLHVIDKALYGPLKLNWIGDIGISLFVLGAGLFYRHLVKQRP